MPRLNALSVAQRQSRWPSEGTLLHLACSSCIARANGNLETSRHPRLHPFPRKASHITGYTWLAWGEQIGIPRSRSGWCPCPAQVASSGCNARVIFVGRSGVAFMLVLAALGCLTPDKLLKLLMEIAGGASHRTTCAAATFHWSRDATKAH